MYIEVLIRGIYDLQSTTLPAIIHVHVQYLPSIHDSSEQLVFSRAAWVCRFDPRNGRIHKANHADTNTCSIKVFQGIYARCSSY
jgi:hypothetical protein